MPMNILFLVCWFSFIFLFFWLSTSHDGQFGGARGAMNPTLPFNGLWWGTHHHTHIIWDMNAHSKHIYEGFSKYTLCLYLHTSSWIICAIQFAFRRWWMLLCVQIFTYYKIQSLDRTMYVEQEIYSTNEEVFQIFWCKTIITSLVLSRI